jgi:dienelactone hydrolase
LAHALLVTTACPRPCLPFRSSGSIGTTVRLASLATLALTLLLVSGAVRAQAPEERGPLAASSWDAGARTLDGVSIRVRVVYPELGGPYPLVGVIHGANANGAYHTELATTLASRGFVVVVPDMPCTVTVCDHDANQRQISALLAWAAAESAEAGTRLAGKVDGGRRGLIGHSWGGLSSHLTAARDPSIGSVVLLDPNDDGTEGLSVTDAISAPHLTLLAQVPGLCNSQWQESMVRARLGGPRLELTVNRSGHCDPGEMDGLCSFGCGRGDTSTTRLFRRYAVAWTACVLGGDPAMVEWVGGPSYTRDVREGTVVGPSAAGLDALACRSGAPVPDAGPTDVQDAAMGLADAGVDSGAGPIMPEDAAVALDAEVRAPDAGLVTAGGPGGCACRAARASSCRTLVPLALFAVAWARRRRSAVRTPRESEGLARRSALEGRRERR